MREINTVNVYKILGHFFVSLKQTKAGPRSSGTPFLIVMYIRYTESKIHRRHVEHIQ